jgi:hypothetical protein
VVQQTADADGYAWFYTVTLSETAGVATTVTSFRIGGTDYSSSIASWFGSANLPAGGTLSAHLRSRNLTVPTTIVFQAGGADSGGRTWTTQASIQFLGRPTTANLSLESLPSVIRQDPNSTTCPWYQELILRETGGFGVTLNSFTAGGATLTSAIADYWGGTALTANGSLRGGICWTGIAPPETITLNVGGVDSGGAAVSATVTGSFSGPAANPTTMSLAPTSVALSANTGFTTPVSTSASLHLGSLFASWAGRLVFTNGSVASWLSVSPLSGSGSATLQFSALPGAPTGAYSATLILTSLDALPETINVPISLTVGSHQGAAVAAQLFPHIADGGEWQTEFLLTNETAAAVTGRLLFHLDGGVQGLPIVGLGTVPEIGGIAIPAHGSVLYRTTGLVSSPVTSGWAELMFSAPLTGQALFRRHAGDGKYYEGAVPLVVPSRAFTIPFDGTPFTDGTPIYSGLAVANANSTATATVTCSAYRDDGVQLGSGLQIASLAASSHTSAILQWSPPTQSVLGTGRGLLICTSTAEIGVLGLRAFGNFAIASLPVTMH